MADTSYHFYVTYSAPGNPLGILALAGKGRTISIAIWLFDRVSRARASRLYVPRTLRREKCHFLCEEWRGGAEELRAGTFLPLVRIFLQELTIQMLFLRSNHLLRSGLADGFRQPLAC